MTTASRIRDHYPDVQLVFGVGDWASVSDCGPGPVVVLAETYYEAERATESWNRLGCGSACAQLHEVADLREDRS